MKKRILAALLCAAMMLTATGCNVKTKDDVTGGSTSSSETTSESTTASGDKVTVKLLTTSSNETDANVIRDQLTKAGFNVELNMQPDYSSSQAQEAAGNFDLEISGWTTVTGNPDYAVKSLFKTGGDYNKSPVADSEIDALIEQAGTETPEEYVNTYAEFEKKLVEENAYIVPLYTSYKAQAVNTTVLVPESVHISKSRSMKWEDIEFVDSSKNETDPLLLTQTLSTLTSLDPIKGNDGSINMLNTNMYVRLVNLTDDDQITSEDSLSYNHAIAEGNQEYYFILRDDINFAKVENKQAVDSGEMVGAEDVVFSLERAKDPNSVPEHRTYTLHESMDTIEIVTDLAALESQTVSGSDTTVRAALEEGLATPISELVADKTAVDNAAGKYQVVKVTTKEPFPQVLNYLAHQSAGIVSKNQVESINTWDVATYDRNTDIGYGDQSVVTEGSTYDNHLMASGPYILLYKNDYEVVFQANPAYMPGTDSAPRIKNITVKFIADNDAALSALRSGEVHCLYSVPETKYDTVESDPNLQLTKIEANSVSYMIYNLREGSQMNNVTLRKAVLAAINQEDLIAVHAGQKLPAYSTLSPLVDTGNKLVYEEGKAQELLAQYQAEIAG